MLAMWMFFWNTASWTGGSGGGGGSASTDVHVFLQRIMGALKGLAHI